MRGYLRHVADGCAPCLKSQDVAIPLDRQSADHPGFLAADRAFSCGACIGWHADKWKFPRLPEEPEVREAWEWYWTLQDQQRMGGMGGALGLDILALKAAFEMAGQPPETWPDLFPLVSLISHEVARHQGDRAAAESERQKDAKRVDKRVTA